MYKQPSYTNGQAVENMDRAAARIHVNAHSKYHWNDFDCTTPLTDKVAHQMSEKAAEMIAEFTISDFRFRIYQYQQDVISFGSKMQHKTIPYKHLTFERTTK